MVQHYSYHLIVQAFETWSAQTAKSMALMAAAKLDEYWSHLRMVDPDLVGLKLLKLGYRSHSRNIHCYAFRAAEPQITLSEALETYLVQKGSNKRKAF